MATQQSRDRDTGDQSETDAPCNGEIPPTDTKAQTDTYIPESSDDTGSRRPSIRKCARWDVFKQHPPEENKDRDAAIRRAESFLKVIVIILFFLLLLFGLMVNKATVFMAIAQFSRTYDITCVGYGNASHSLLAEVCVAHAQGTTLDPYSLHCSGVHGLQPRSVIEHLPNCPAAYMRWLWCLMLFMIIPYICIIARDLWLIFFKNEPNPRRDVFIVSLTVDTISTVGMCLFVFRVLTVLDNTFQGIAILMGTSVVPSFLLMLNIPKDCKKNEQSTRHEQPDEVAKESCDNRNDRKNTAIKAVVICLNILAFLAQVSVLFLIPVKRVLHHPDERFYYEMPISMIMVSVGWWENYADPAWNFFCDRQKYNMLGADARQTGDTFLQSLREAKVKLSFAGNIWKVFLTILMAFMLNLEYSFSDWFNFLSNPLDCEDFWGNDVTRYNEGTLKTEWVILLAIGIFDTIAVYFLVRTCAKIRIQAATIGLATLLVTPVMLGSMVLICYHWTDDACVLSDVRPLHMFWSCNKNEIEDFFFVDYGWLTIFWWLSQVWVSRHIWSPTADRLAKSKHLFVNPLVDAILLAPWVMHNRRRIDNPEAEKNKTAKIEEPLADEEDKDVFPMVYMCATLWHENRAEMMEILKSLFRTDLEQFKRKLFKDTLMVESSDYFEFEAHIFFDDAMTAYDSPEDDHTVNDFVKMFVEVMDDAATAVHQDHVHVEGPTRFNTPYGGRLEWKMPGENKIIAHLKDKNKIRHKKRWSQVMYMYYLLGFCLMNKIRTMPDRSRTKRCQVADNTFILALDGDVEFKPDALHKLVDLMKKDKKVGAACGRIHPVGTGPMVWYQLFEYAIGHWLQKSTEHVLGSVLCSPGCFSLFRGSSLMDSNVARTYATLPSEAKHYIQYDQGEDRWLCTLLLQQGYRVEYCAASDAYTFAPEGFYEFFNQRRRWMPSTMANIIDLLVTWRTTIKKNENISFLYIIYQAVLLLASILGSGTIFLMIIGALKITTQAMTMTQSFLLNMVPILVFVIICYVCKSDIQLFVSAILTVAYSLLQMLVLVGIIIQISNDGPNSPNAIFFFFVAGTFVLAALLHPQECLCVVHGFIYFLAVPSMYMLLMIYALTNLHVISWGTREVVQTKTEKEEEEEKKAAEEAKKAESKGLPFVRLGSAASNEEGFTVSLGNLCRCICCPRDVSTNQPIRADGYQRLELAVREVKVTLDEAIVRGNMRRTSTTADEPDLDNGVTRGAGVRRSKSALSTMSRMSLISRRRLSMRHTDSVDASSLHGLTEEPEDAEFEDDVFSEEEEEEPEPKLWIDDDVFKTGEQASLPPAEEQFFKELIETYLKPLAKDKKREEKIEQQLIELRNKMSGTFLLLNAIFIVVVFTLQINVESVHLVWPWGTAKDGSPLMLEPVGLTFLIIFGSIMLLQIWGMVSHRFTTFQHILSTTTLPCEKDEYDDKRLQESTRETIFETLMYKKGSVYSTLYDDDDGKPPIKVKTSSEIAALYRQSLIDFKEDPMTLANNIPEGDRRKRAASVKKRERALTYLRMESRAPGLKTPEATRRRGMTDLSTTQSTWRRDIDRALSDVEMATLPPDPGLVSPTTCRSETGSIGPCSIDSNSHIEQEDKVPRRNTQTDSETALIHPRDYFTTDL